MPSLEELYKEVILDHYKNPRNTGELEPPAVKSEGHNPLCGDDITLYVTIEDGVIKDVKMKSTGCSISQASASMMTGAIKDKTTDEALELMDTVKQMLKVHLDGSESDGAVPPGLGDLAALQGVVQFPVRIKCATLSWNTLAEAINQATATSN